MNYYVTQVGTLKRNLIEQAKTNNIAFSSKQATEVAWIFFGLKTSISLKPAFWGCGTG
jgi:hypothetical protein